MSRIFLSHSSKDNDSAVALRDWLAAQGWDDVFLDLDPQRGIAAGDRWERALNQAALRCEAVLFLVSRSWLASGWCQKEFNLAHRLNKRLFGLLIDDLPVGDLPVTLTGTWQVVPLASGRDHTMLTALLPGTQDEARVTFSREGLTRLRLGLERAGLDARFFNWPPDTDPNRPPYRGLLPLEAADAGIFFGREASIVEALDRIRGIKDGAGPRLLVVLGASGAGKSSFLRAGLLPRLARDDRNYLALSVMRPEQAAISGEAGLLRSLEVAFAERGLAKPRAEIREAIAGGATTLRPLLQVLITQTQGALIADDPNAKAPILLLAIDQGEELFLADGASEGAALLTLLRDLLVNDDPAVLAAITIRSDAYEQLQTAKPLEGVMQQQTLSLMPMPRGAYQAVIEGPAERLKETDRPLVVEPGLTQALLSDIEEGGGRDALPLLAFTLERLYLEYSGRGRLTLKDYNALGRIKGSIEAAVERAFRAADNDARIPRNHDARLALLRRGLIPWLAGIDPDTGSPRRQKARLSEIPGEARALIDLFVEQRLLSTDLSKDTGERTIEPAHEALLRQWGLLQGWLKEDFAALMNLETVKRATRDWAANAKSEDWLAHRAGRLEDAGTLLLSPDIAGKLDQTDRDYLTACSEREVAEQSEKTAVLERRIRLQRQLAITAVLSAIIMTTFGLFAYHQKTKADEGAQIARAQTVRANANESQALAALSMAAAKDGWFVGSIDLALAGWPRSSTDPRPRHDMAMQSLSLGMSVGAVLGEYRHDGTVNGALQTRDGTRILSWSKDQTVRLWDVATGRQIGPVMLHNGNVKGALLTGDESRILSWSDDHAVRLWNAATGRQIGPAMLHDDAVRGALLMRDETRILSWSTDNTLRMWDAGTGRQIGPSMQHDTFVSGALLTGDESHVLSWSYTTLRMWDVSTGRELFGMQHDGWVSGAHLSRDESRILSWSDSSLRLWDGATGRQIGPTMKHDHLVIGARLTPNGAHILSWSADNTVRFWDATTGRQIGPSMPHDAPVWGALFTRDEARILSWSADNTMRLWEVSTGQQIGPAMQHSGPVRDAIFSNDETRILSWSFDKSVRLWATSTGQQIGPAMQHDGTVEGARLIRDETLILSWSTDRTVRLWDQVTGHQVGAAMLHNETVSGALPTHYGNRILSWSYDHTIRLWDMDTRRQIGPAMQHDGAVGGALLSGDETRVLSWSEDKTLGLWDVATSRQIGPFMRHDDPVWGALLTSDQTRIVSWSSDHTVRLWDAATGRQVGPAMEHDGPVRGALLTRDEARVLSWSEKTLRLWDVATGRQIGPIMRHDEMVGGVQLTRDGARILSWSQSTFQLWDVATGLRIGPAKQLPRVNNLRLTHDETRMVSWSNDNSVRLWDVATGYQIGPTMQHDGAVIGARLSRDETRILSWSTDKTVRQWDVATGRQIGPAMRHDGAVMGALLNNDETRILSWSYDYTVRLWDVATGQQIGPAMQHDKEVEGAMFTRDQMHVLSWSFDHTLRLWNVAWRGRNLFEIACNHSPPDHDLTAASTRFGLKLDDPICQLGKTIPGPESSITTY